MVFIPSIKCFWRRHYQHNSSNVLATEKRQKELWQHYFEDYLRPCKRKIIHNTTSFSSSYQHVQIEKFRFLHISASLYRHSVWIGLDEFACSDEWSTYLSGDWNVYLFRKEPCVERDCVDPVCEVGIYYLISTWWKNTLLIFRTAVNFNFVVLDLEITLKRYCLKLNVVQSLSPTSQKQAPRFPLSYLYQQSINTWPDNF